METSTLTPETNNSQADACAAMFAKPQAEHEWLQQLVGEWTFESQCIGEPGKESAKFLGRETVTSLGGLWVLGNGQGDSPAGIPATMMITLGFDAKRGRFVGTWVGSMMTHLWVYDGELDADRRVLTLNSEGPSFTDPSKLAKYQDIIEIKGPDHRIMTSRSLNDDGTWTQFMTAHYRRVK